MHITTRNEIPGNLSVNGPDHLGFVWLSSRGEHLRRFQILITAAEAKQLIVDLQAALGEVTA